MGAVIVCDSDRDKTMVQELLDLKGKADKIIMESFSNNEKFHNVVRVSGTQLVRRTLICELFTGLL